MGSSAIKCLLQLRDDALFCQVSSGLGHILEAVNRFDRSARRLPGYGKFYSQSIHSQAGHTLTAIAEEEAAKYLILIDFVRCPRSLHEERSRQLDYFCDHLPKGIYAEYCSFFPADFKEIIRYVKSAREKYYLDGPNNVDWIFGNDILHRRIDKLYVDYVSDGNGECYWQYYNPKAYLLGHQARTVVEIASALHQAGVASPEGLAVVADVWRAVKVTSEMTSGELQQLNRRTLETLKSLGCLAKAPDQVYGKVIQQWPFPLYPLDLTIKDVKKADLHEIQENWIPDW